MKTYDSVIETIGRTHLVKLGRLFAGAGAEVCLKMESHNPMGSVKDRIGVAMIDDAEKRGVLKKDTVIIEPTSGNTGIALAFVAAARKYRLILAMPESMSLERRAMLKALGAELVLTPAEKGMRGAIEKANELVQQTPGAWMPQQFENPANPAIHEATTGPEIWEDSGHKIDAIISGVAPAARSRASRGSSERRTRTSRRLRSSRPIRPSLAAASPARTRSRASAPGSSRRTSIRRS